MESRVVASTRLILEVLEKHQVRATFFVLGWVGQHYPELVEAIHRDGHEIGTHSFLHRLVYDQTPEEFRMDLRESCDVISQITGEPVLAYRAPSFSITKKSLWALSILAEEGLRIDSSIYPIHHDRYGVSDARQDIHLLETPGGKLWEFPPTALGGGRIRFPVGGGGYFRLYPWWFTRKCLNRFRSNGQPFMFYTHPWEVDPGQPRLRVGSRLAQLRHHINLAGTLGKLDALLGEFRFGTMTEVIAEAEANLEPMSPVVSIDHQLQYQT